MIVFIKCNYCDFYSVRFLFLPKNNNGGYRISKWESIKLNIFIVMEAIFQIDSEVNNVSFKINPRGIQEDWSTSLSSGHFKSNILISCLHLEYCWMMRTQVKWHLSHLGKYNDELTLWNLQADRMLTIPLYTIRWDRACAHWIFTPNL